MPRITSRQSPVQMVWFAQFGPEVAGGGGDFSARGGAGFCVKSRTIFRRFRTFAAPFCSARVTAVGFGQRAKRSRRVGVKTGRPR